MGGASPKTCQPFHSSEAGDITKANDAQPSRPDFEGLTIGLIDINLVSGRATLDDVAVRLLGGDDGWLVAGVDMHVLFEKVHQADRKQVNDTVAAASPASSAFATEYRTHPKDGLSRRIVSYGRLQFDGKGQAVRLVGIVMEIAPLRPKTPLSKLAAPAAEADLVALADHVIAARQLIDKIGFTDLRSGIDTLLLRIGAELARGVGRLRDKAVH